MLHSLHNVVLFVKLLLEPLWRDNRPLLAVPDVSFPRREQVVVVGFIVDLVGVRAQRSESQLKRLSVTHRILWHAISSVPCSGGQEGENGRTLDGPVLWALVNVPRVVPLRIRTIPVRVRGPVVGGAGTCLPGTDVINLAAKHVLLPGGAELDLRVCPVMTTFRRRGPGRVDPFEPGDVGQFVHQGDGEIEAIAHPDLVGDEVVLGSRRRPAKVFPEVAVQLGHVATRSGDSGLLRDALVVHVRAVVAQEDAVLARDAPEPRVECCGVSVGVVAESLDQMLDVVVSSWCPLLAVVVGLSDPDPLL